MSASPRRKHAIDLDYIIGLCVIKLKPPRPRSAPSTLLASAVDAAETAVATEVTHLIGSDTTRLITDRLPVLTPAAAEAEPRACALCALRHSLPHNRGMFGIGVLRLLAQLSVGLRRLRNMHDHTASLGCVVRDELLDRGGL